MFAGHGHSFEKVGTDSPKTSNPPKAEKSKYDSNQRIYKSRAVKSAHLSNPNDIICYYVLKKTPRMLSDAQSVS